MNSWMKYVVIVAVLVVLCPLIAQAYAQWVVQPVPFDATVRLEAQQLYDLLPSDGQVDPALSRPGMSHEAFMTISVERAYLKQRMMRVAA